MYACSAVYPESSTVLKMSKVWAWRKYRNKLSRARYGQFDHESKACHNDMVCINLGGKHFADLRVFKLEHGEGSVYQLQLLSGYLLPT